MPVRMHGCPFGFMHACLHGRLPGSLFVRMYVWLHVYVGGCLSASTGMADSRYV